MYRFLVAVVAKITAPSGEKQTIKASWMIGCDGAHSTVRKHLNLSFEGKMFSDVFSLADVHIQWDQPKDEIIAFLQPQGVLAAFPIPGRNRYRLIFQLKRLRNALNHHEEKSQILNEESNPPSLQEVQDLLHSYAGNSAKLFDPVWMANFHINSRLASSYKKARVFLAGDAGHIHSPVGGQGMNTGIQDAFNLAWKIAFVHYGHLSSDLLDTYDLERRDVAKTLLNMTEKASTMATLKNPILVFLRNHFMNWLINLEAFQKRFTHVISQTGIRYDKNKYIQEDGKFSCFARLGQRAPNISFQNEKTSLFALMEQLNTYMNIVFIDSENDLEKLKELQEHPLIRTVVISKLKFVKQPTYIDDEGAAYEKYGIDKSGIYILRPDGHITYRAKGLNMDKVSAYYKSLSL